MEGKAVLGPAVVVDGDVFVGKSVVDPADVGEDVVEDAVLGVKIIGPDVVAFVTSASVAGAAAV